MNTFTTSVRAEPTLSPHQLWDAATHELRSRLSEGTFAAWFGDCEPLAFHGATLELSVPSPFVRDWIENRYRGAVMTALLNAAGHHIELLLTPLTPLASPDPTTPPPTAYPQPPAPHNPNNPPPTHTSHPPHTPHPPPLRSP
ncbi:MAG: DnaA N-terminal domain-containing protein, partial [Actinomycetota bacterium]